MSSTSVTRRIATLAFIGGLGGGLVFPILPALGLRLGIPGFMIGLILSSNRISRLIFNVPAGHLIARLGPRLTLSGALLLESVGVLGYSAALHFGNAMWWLLGGRTLFGVGTAFLLVGAQTAVLRLSNEADRGRKISIVRVAISAAVPGGLIFGGVLADLFSDNATFLTGAAITLAGAVFAAVFLPRAIGRPDEEKSKLPEPTGFRSLSASPNLPFLVAAWGFNLLVFLTIQGVLLSTMVLLVQQRHIHLFGMRAQGTSGLVMAVLIGCSALAAFAIGRVIDAAALRSTLLVPALAGLAAGFTVLAVAQTLWLTLIGSVLVGLSCNGVTLPVMALLGDVLSSRQHGPAVSIYQFFGDIGGAIGPIVGIEAGMNWGLMPLYLATAVLPALAVFVAFRLRDYERRLRAAPVSPSAHHIPPR